MPAQFPISWTYSGRMAATGRSVLRGSLSRYAEPFIAAMQGLPAAASVGDELTQQLRRRVGAQDFEALECNCPFQAIGAASAVFLPLTLVEPEQRVSPAPGRMSIVGLGRTGQSTRKRWVINESPAIHRP